MRSVLGILLLGCSVATVYAQPAEGEKKVGEPKSVELPAPTPVQPGPTYLLPTYVPMALPQPGTREVWQYYGVDSRGRWVPRVIMAPAGAYYYYNGEPFRYTNTRPSLFMPYVVD